MADAAQFAYVGYFQVDLTRARSQPILNDG